MTNSVLSLIKTFLGAFHLVLVRDYPVETVCIGLPTWGSRCVFWLSGSNQGLELALSQSKLEPQTDPTKPTVLLNRGYMRFHVSSLEGRVCIGLGLGAWVSVTKTKCQCACLASA